MCSSSISVYLFWIYYVLQAPPIQGNVVGLYLHQHE